VRKGVLREDGSSTPKVSVCVPTYNGASYLAECLQTIQRQTLEEFECVIVDDQSSDETVSIASDFAAADKRFHVFENAARLGLAANWNRAIELSRGCWVKLLFQDDLMDPACLQQLVAACEDSEAMFGFCRRKVLVEEDVEPDWHKGVVRQAKLLNNLYGHRRKLSAEEFTEAFSENSDANLIGEPSVTIFSRAAIREVGLFEVALIQLADTEYWTRLGSNYGVVHVPEELAVFRLHSMSTTSRNLQHRKYRMFVLDALVQRYLFLSKPHYHKLRRALRLRGSELADWKAFLRFVNDARRLACAGGLETATDRERMLQEWRTVAERFPLLRLLGFASDAVARLRTIAQRLFRVRRATSVGT